MTSHIEVPDLELIRKKKWTVLERLVMALAVWNAATTVLVLVVAFLCGKPILHALLLMVSGLSLLWICLCGSIMVAFRNPIRERIRRLRLDWRITFVLFCTLLALIEEAITTTMTNCAPLFGVPLGSAYITASTNYLYVVCLHSVVAFVPMFAAWAWMLNRWSFRPEAVLLLFGLTGILAETIFGGLQSVAMFGFWILVYGLMVYLPAYCLSAERPTRQPGIGAVLLALVFPLLCSAPVALIVSHLHPVRMHFAPMVIDPQRPDVPAGPPYTGFHTPQRVTLRGYTGDAMEPFVTKDGKYLFFNNLNDPSVNTNLYYAARIDDLTFEYKGEIQGVNTPVLEGVPSMDRNGTLYFVSTRSYASTFSTLYRGQFKDGVVTNVELVPEVSQKKPGIVNFDAEISDDGETLYFVDGDLSKGGMPSAADIVIATREGTGFRRDPNSAEILRNVNTSALEYAPSISPDGLELFFTRFDKNARPPVPTIYRAARTNKTKPFDPPQHVGAIEGFVEAPTLDAGGHALYYHKRENGRFVLYRVTR